MISADRPAATNTDSAIGRTLSRRSPWPPVPPGPLGNYTDGTFGLFCCDSKAAPAVARAELGVRVGEPTARISDR